MKTPVRTRLLSALLSLVMLVSLLPVSVFAAEPASGTWEKVTEAQEDWSGQYLIVYEKGSLIMDGSLSALDKEGNKVDVTITDGKIVGDYAKYAFTIAPMTGGWSVQSASGKYISGKSGSNKIITGSTPELNTITFADGNVKIASNNTTLQYNAAATNGTRFRYYKSENQQPVALYKLSTVPARESGIVTDLTTLQNGDKVVLFNPANKKALSSVYNGFYNTGVDVELTGGKLTGYTDAELWTVNRTESGAYTFSTAEGKKLSMDTSYSSTPLDKAHTGWTLEQAATEGCYYIKNVGRSSYLEWYAEKNNWSAFGTIGSNEALFAQAFFKIQKSGIVTSVSDGDQVVVFNPANGKVVPMFVSDYVLMGYGTGIVMGVPGHDQRDWDFATAFHIPIVEVVEGGDITKEAFTLKDDTGIMVNSGFLNGMTVKEAIPAMKQYAIEQGWGHEKVNYKLRDWVFSRQRYWGEPIPLVNCPTCGWVPVPEEELPLVLPQVESYEPTDDGESPISKMIDWVNTKCPKCGGPAKRETDTMPQWAGSSWYFLRYMDPHNDKALVSHEAENYWGPVDWYNGGMEHTTLHLLYSRFWHKFLYDIGVVHTKEPYAKRTSHGMILGQNPHYVGNVSTQEEKDALIAKYGNQALRPAVKMSKSLGNVVNPDDVVKAYGADTMRLYIMFIGDFEKVATWSDDAVKGCKRFLDRVWNLADQVTEEDGVSEKNAPIVHKTIKKVTDDIDTLKMNTAIAALMAMVNEFYSNGLSRGDFEALLLMLSPFAPHMVEELWEQKGFAAKYEGKMAMQCAWPEYDESKTVASSVEMAVQVSGKFKGTIIVPVDSDQDTVVEAAKASEKVAKAIAGMQIVKVIHVKNKLVNLIVKPC